LHAHNQLRADKIALLTRQVLDQIEPIASHQVGGPFVCRIEADGNRWCRLAHKALGVVRDCGAGALDKDRNVGVGEMPDVRIYDAHHAIDVVVRKKFGNARVAPRSPDKAPKRQPERTLVVFLVIQRPALWRVCLQDWCAS
jgi:hypothetical protein